MSSSERKLGTLVPGTMLVAELDALRKDLRSTIRAYSARLEIDLAESTAAVTARVRTGCSTREQLHDIRELTTILRKRKVKPEKGRRKDLRKLDDLIRDLHAMTHPDAPP